MKKIKKLVHLTFEKDMHLVLVSLIGFTVLFLVWGLNERITSSNLGLMLTFIVPLIYVWMTCLNYFLVNITDKKEYFVKKKLDYLVFGIDVILDFVLIYLLLGADEDITLCLGITFLLFALNPAIMCGLEMLSKKLEVEFYENHKGTI